jgi:hypothetical protein
VRVRLDVSARHAVFKVAGHKPKLNTFTTFNIHLGPNVIVRVTKMRAKGYKLPTMGILCALRIKST